MRFLHTADWHIGKTLRGRSRMEEFAAALEEVGRVAREAQVDAVLVAGDLFDSPMPPPEAERLVYDFLARLLPERIACVVIAGNHDHPRKLGALAHLLISGARVGTGERPLHLGEIYGVNAQQVPAGIQYVGLGHLHRPQEVLAPSRTFYAGSLIELDFGEKEQDKRVMVVDAHPGGAAVVESVPIRAGRRLRDLRGSLREVLALAPDAGRDYLRVTVEASTPMPGLAEQVREHLPNALDVRLVLRGAPAETPLVHGNGARPPAEVFAAYYREKHGAAPAPQLLALFQEVYAEATEP